RPTDRGSQSLVRGTPPAHTLSKEKRGSRSGLPLSCAARTFPRRGTPARGGGGHLDRTAALSATARRRGSGRRWDVPATPAVPDAAAKTAAKKTPAKPKDAAAAGHAESGIESAKRRLHRLALDVHDGAMQNLAVIGFSLGDLRRKLTALVPADQQAGIDAGMEQIGAELGRVESDLRSLISALEHGGVTSVPVVDAVEMEIEEFERRSAVAPELIVSGDVRTETDSQRIALQSITRSALANVAKHAAAQTVTVRLIGAPDSVTLVIEDDGRG